jgi:hypothetical protein
VKGANPQTSMAGSIVMNAVRRYDPVRIEVLRA